MQFRRVIAGAAISGVIGMGGLAMAGTASATSEPTTPGSTTTVSKSTTVNKTNVNLLSGNKTTVVLKVSVLNGAFSNNIVNTGANSFNTPTTINKTWQSYFNSFNTTTVNKTTTVNNTTTTTTTGDTSCQGNCGANQGPDGPQAPGS